MAKSSKKDGGQRYDWEVIRLDYITDPKSSLRKISEKYGIRQRTVEEKSRAENWFASRKKYQRNLTEKVAAKMSAKKAEKRANELVDLLFAPCDAIRELNDTLAKDPQYWHKHIVSRNLNEEQDILDLINFKAMKDMMRVIKDVEEVKRSIMDIKKSETAERLAIERERLELEKERIALERERNALRSQNMGADSDANYGVVLIPEVLTDE